MGAPVKYRSEPEDIDARIRALTANVRELRRQIEGGATAERRSLARANDARLPREHIRSVGDRLEKNDE
jgi:hypothetical protein